MTDSTIDLLRKEIAHLSHQREFLLSKAQVYGMESDRLGAQIETYRRMLKERESCPV